MSMGVKLQKLRKNKKLSMDNLVLEISRQFPESKISKGMLSRWENDHGKPSFKNQQILANYFKVSLDYLVGDSEFKNRSDSTNFWQAYDSELGDAKLKALAEEVQAYDTGTTQINVYGTIPAGVPIQAIQDIDDTISIPTQWLKGGNEFIALRVKGDSMYPKYEDGDIVVIQLQPDCENGEDCACYVNGDDVTLKRVYKSDGSITLQPLNSAYRPMTFKHPGEVVILGKVAEQRRSTKY